MSDIFWASKPLILIDRNQITHIWPTSKMHYIEKLNAITRLTIVLTVLGYLVHPNTRIIMIGIATILIIVLIQLGYKDEINNI